MSVTTAASELSRREMREIAGVLDVEMPPAGGDDAMRRVTESWERVTTRTVRVDPNGSCVQDKCECTGCA